MHFSNLSALLGFILQSISVQGHMYLFYPPTFNATNNPHRTTAPDPFLNHPYNCCGRTDPFPCKGYLSLLGTPDGRPVASWAAGSTQNFSLIAGIAGVDSEVTGGNHFGGSCQVGFSIDNGTTWKVATSYEGNCPLRNGGETPEGQTFDFKVPTDIPAGDQLFAWTWVNREQEFQMNCAAVSILPRGNGAARHSSVSSSQVLPTTLQTSVRPPSPSIITVTVTDFVPAATSSQSVASSPLGQSKVRNSNSKPVAFNNRPDMLFADISNGCITPLTTAELKFPAPGPDVVEGDGAYPLELPTPQDKCGY